MSKTQVAIEQRAGRSGERFRVGPFKRVVMLTWQFKRVLIIGLLATVAYACMHTASIGAAFPVFKILLEQEGLQGWIDRSFAGKRLDAVFAPPGDGRQLLLVKVGSDGVLGDANLTPGALLLPPGDAPATAWLHEVAFAADGTKFEVIYRTDASTKTNPVQPLTPQTITLHVRTLGKLDTLWLRAARMIPPGIDDDKIGTLKIILLALIAAVVLSNTFRYIGEVFIAKGVLLAMMDLRGQLYERSLLLPLAYYSGRPTADIVGRFVQDMQEVQRGMLSLFAKFIREPLRAALILSLALALDWRLTLTIIIAGPIALAIFWRIGKRVKNANRKLLVAYCSMIDALTASLQNLRVVKAYTAEAHERRKLKGVDFRIYRQQLKLAKLQALGGPLMESLAALGGSLVTVWLASQVVDHHLGMSKFVMLGMTISMLFDPMRKLTEVYVRLIRASAGAERVFEVLDAPIETSHADAKINDVREGITFDNVSFTYPGAEQPALRGIDLKIEAGETVALVGPNGSGKTTLVGLLPRMFDPSAGRILIDGVELSHVALASLRRAIALVSQDAIIFACTPLENIAYGAESPDRDRAIESARRAHADEFIEALPGTYDGNLGERGSTLSGGQRQRIAIARAIYRDAPILIFDEATSQIDSESEKNIQNVLREFSKDRTTIMIAHRLSTIQFADRIVVLESGGLIDTGTHQELYERCVLYRSLCDTQFASEQDHTRTTPSQSTPSE